MTTIKLPAGIYRYDPAKPIGKRGGFGQVYTGQTDKGDEVAVKKLHVSAADAAHRELRVAEELKGRSFEHVITFIDSGQDADTGDYFVVMPKAERSLQDLIDSSGVLAVPDAAVVLLQIVKGLMEVDELVHRDLKPDNVLFHKEKWMIADFGIARFIEEATASNTLKDYLSDWYAAPEQWRGERATHSTDVYSFGCIAFCLLTGKPPFTKNPHDEHQHAPVPAFTCTDPRLTNLINMCLRKNDATRPVLSRLHGLISEIASKPQLSNISNSLGALADAAALVSTAEQEAEAREKAEKAAIQVRIAHTGSAFEILEGNAERLWGKIHLQAPNAIRLHGGGKYLFECQLGKGSLSINLNSANVLPPDSLPRSGWDIVTYSHIYLQQNNPHCYWSASLWFVKMRGGTEYRWNEISFFDRSKQIIEVTQLRPGVDASLAVTHRSGDMCVAFGPVVIDDEEEDSFHDRWIWLFSKAAVGKLTVPSRLPFGWPPPLLA